MNIESKRNKIITIVATFGVFSMLCIIGYTIAYFSILRQDTNTITGTISGIPLTLTINKIQPNNNDYLIPQLDSYIADAALGVNFNIANAS